MKRKLPLLILTSICAMALTAQVTISNAYFPAAGDTLRSAFDALPSIDLGQNGENSWNFTSLAGVTSETVFRAASSGDFFGDFPTSELVVGSANLNTGELYYNVTDNLYELMGYVGPDPANFGINLLARLDPYSVERRAPLNFFDVNSADTDLVIAFSTDLIPSDILDSLPGGVDSIRFRVTTDRLDVVDAWGTLSIPGGTYEVLREKRTQERETRMDVKIGPFWFDLTDVIGMDFLGKDTTTTYHFFSNDIKEAVAVVTVDNITEDPVSVQYKSNGVISSSKYVDKGKSDVFAYPNPAVTEVRFDFINLPIDTYDLKIYNILGVEIYRQKYFINGRRTVKLDLTNMRKGTYLYSLLDRKGKPITTKRLIVLKP